MILKDYQRRNLLSYSESFMEQLYPKKAKEYSKSGLINLRAGLNCHLQDQSHRRTIDFMNDYVFLQANKVFSGRLCDNKDRDLDVSKARELTEQEDMQKLFKEYFTPGLKELDTQVLIHKVFFDITSHRGKEGLCIFDQRFIWDKNWHRWIGIH